MKGSTLRALVPIYGTTFADTLGYTLMIPLLPVIAHRFHASYVMAGALLSVPAFCSAIAAPISGKLSDRLGRKPIIVGAQVLSLIGYLVLATSHGYAWILISRVISGCGGGSLGAVESYIADVTENRQRDAAYSMYGAVFGIAFVIGPAVSGALVHHGGFALPFFVAAAIEAGNIVFTVFFLPRSQKNKREKATSTLSSLRAALEPKVRVVFVQQFLFILAVVCFLANFGLYLEKVLRLDVSRVGWLLAAAGVVGGLVLLLVVTPLAHRIGDPRVTLLGLLVSLVAYAGLVAVRGVPLFCAVLVLWAAGAAMVEPTITTMLSSRAKRSERGAIMGTSDSLNSVAMMIGPAAGAAIVGSAPTMLGVLPFFLVLGAFVLGWIRKPARAEA